MVRVKENNKDEERNWFTGIVTAAIVFVMVAIVIFISGLPSDSTIYEKDGAKVVYTFGDCLYASNESEQPVEIKVYDTVTELGYTYGDKVQVGLYGEKGEMTIYVNDEPIVIDYIPSNLYD